MKSDYNSNKPTDLKQKVALALSFQKPLHEMTLQEAFDSGYVLCPECKGTCEIEEIIHYTRKYIKCPNCEGEGLV